MAYYKSHSNYTIKSRHQDIGDGVIYERDFTTIGGLNQFAKGETPIYKSDNFIIAPSNHVLGSKDYVNTTWILSSNENPNIWTLDDVKAYIDSSKYTTTLTNRDYYVLKDFAYYGSCSELIRTSILNIIQSFPGELYSPFTNNGESKQGLIVYYTNYNTNENIMLGDGTEYLLDNPFNINIHTTHISQSEQVSSIKYFANGGYKKYNIIFGEDEAAKIPITSCKVDPHIGLECALPGDRIATITLNDIYVINAYMGNTSNIIYLTNVIDMHIRPSISIYDDFYNKLSLFESVLLNKYSHPKYTATFEVTKETEYGYETALQNFTFPTTYGGYNLSVGLPPYEDYIGSLIQISNFYDTIFCDNLYRSMTHESIKNFDWTDQHGSMQDSINISKNKIRQLIHLFGHEFDVLKAHIDDLQYASTLSYKSNAYSEQLLSSIIQNDGIIVYPIIPYVKNKDNIIQENSFSVAPYSNDITKNCYPYGYFINTTCETRPNQSVDEYKTPAVQNDGQYKIINGTLRPKIQSFISQQAYSLGAINTFFLKNLKLNIKHILRHKGTIASIEMILGLLGLSSKRWYDLSFNTINGVKTPKNTRYFNNCDHSNEWQPYYFEICEYVAYTNPIIDSFDQDKGDYVIDFYNKTKTFAYDTTMFKNGTYVSYQGLPINYNDVDDTRYLTPFFCSRKELDGDPYYQMNGGWMFKSMTLSNDKIINNVYSDTIKEVRTVQTIKDLLSIPYNKLYDKILYKVLSLDGNYVLINGQLFELKSEYRLVDNQQVAYRYFETSVNNGQINIGNQSYSGTIAVSFDSSPNNELLEKSIDLTTCSNGSYIKIFEINGMFTIHDAYFDRSDFADLAILEAVVFDKENIDRIKNGTNYFQLNSRNEHHMLSLRTNDSLVGWVRLLDNDSAYLSLSILKNNYLGNNPHTGKYKYDDGGKYLDMYKTLFCESISQKAINFQCFPDKTKNEVLCELETFGFKNLQPRIKTDKIEYFGNLFIETDGKVSAKRYSNIIHDSDTEYNLTDKALYPQYQEVLPTHGFTNQIINTKYIDIIFYYKSISDLFIKFMDEVVLKYLEQVLPPNAIIRILYKELP